MPAPQKKHKRSCKKCGSKFLISTSVKNRGGGLFCSRKCANVSSGDKVNRAACFGWWQDAYNTGVRENINRLSKTKTL